MAWNRHYYRIKGNRHYELSNHLGNVLAVVTDRKLGQDTTVNATYTPQYYLPDIYSVQNYYAFGQNLPKWSSSALNDPKRYRFGFNGKEDEDEWTKQDYGFRMYDPRVARFLSVDPLAAAYPWYTPYQFAGDMPIWAADLDGLEPDYKGSFSGQTEVTGEQGTGDVYAWSWTGSEWRRGLKEVTIKSSKKDNGVGFRIPKVEYSDSDYDNYSASSDYSSRDWKTAVNAGVNVANMGIDVLDAVVHPRRTIAAVAQKGYQLLSWYSKPLPAQAHDVGLWGGAALSGVNSSIGDPNVGDQVLTFGLLTGMSLPAGGGVAAGEAGAGRAFWSGAGSEARALEEGFGTLGQTRAGQNLIKLTEGMPYYPALNGQPASQAYLWWGRLSTQYAKGASGTVHVFQNAQQGVSMQSIWRLYEYPTLLKNPSVSGIIFH